MSFTDDTDPRTLVAKFLDSLTGPTVQMYVRIGLYTLAGAAAAHGYGDTQNSYESYAISAVAFFASLAWTIYGNRLVAKIKNLMATGKIAAIHTTDKALADAVPDNRVTAA